MIRNLALVLPLLALIACGNSIDLEKGETKVIKLIQDKLERRTGPAAYIDARKLVSRAIIDGVDVPILFVEIDRGQNGTMTQYPGEGVGQTWLGVDGSTVTLAGGMLKATRGVGDDLMGSEISRQINWKNPSDAPYTRKLAYLREDNQTRVDEYECSLTDTKKYETIEVFDAKFRVRRITETCRGDGIQVVNDYRVDDSGLVRTSRQYHGEKIGFMIIERLDR